MARKWLCLAIALLFLFPSINENTGKDIATGNEKTTPFHRFHAHSFFSNFIYHIFMKWINHPPVALINREYEGIVGKAIIFNASSSYDPDSDTLQYRWDFDNDGIYDTPWISLPEIKHVYNKPYNGFVRLEVKDAHDAMDECVARVMIKNAQTTPITQEIDQHQEKEDGYVKIYEDKIYAQSFKPSMCGLDGIDLLIARHGLTGEILKKLFGISAPNIFLGDLVVGIYGELGDIFSNESVRNSKVFETRISPDKISRVATWVHIDISNVELKDKTYYIVVYQDGGNPYQYYKWYYGSGDPYDRGKAYSSSWATNWQEFGSNDFCFRSYAHKTGDEPDGKEERWAVIFGCLETHIGIDYYADNNAYDLRDTLLSHGWDASHIKVLISPRWTDVKNGIEWLDSMDDGDDIDVVAWSSHGGEGGFWTKDGGIVYDRDMNPWLNKCDAKGMFIAISTCNSGGAIEHLAAEGRVIMTSCKEDESTGTPPLLKNSVFFYFLAEPYDDKYPRDGKPDGALNQESMDKNNNGWVSAEEVYQYVYSSVSTWVDEHANGRYSMHPQLYDGYDGDLDVTYFGS